MLEFLGDGAIFSGGTIEFTGGREAPWLFERLLGLDLNGKYPLIPWILYSDDFGEFDSDLTSMDGSM